MCCFGSDSKKEENKQGKGGGGAGRSAYPTQSTGGEQGEVKRVVIHHQQPAQQVHVVQQPVVVPAYGYGYPYGYGYGYGGAAEGVLLGMAAHDLMFHSYYDPWGYDGGFY